MRSVLADHIPIEWSVPLVRQPAPVTRRKRRAPGLPAQWDRSPRLRWLPHEVEYASRLAVFEHELGNRAAGAMTNDRMLKVLLAVRSEEREPATQLRLQL